MKLAVLLPLLITISGCTIRTHHEIDVEAGPSAKAKPNYRLTWQYYYQMPTTGINFEVWKSSNLSTWTLFATVAQPPVNVGNNVNNAYFRVRACNSTACSDWGNGTTPVPPPPLPKSLTLSWTPSTTPSVNSYKIYRGQTSGAYNAGLDILGTATTYTDSTILPGSNYFYAVTSLVKTPPTSQESAFSNEVSLTPTNKPAPPYSVQIIRQ